MNFWVHHFPATVIHIAWLAFLPLLIFSGIRLKKAPPNAQSVLLSIGLLSVLWSLHVSLHAGEQAGMMYHLLGSTLITLILGFPAALCLFSTMSVFYILIFQGASQLPILALNVMTVGLPAILITDIILFLARRYLPKQPFIFIFINAFFAAALSMMSVGLIIVLTLSFSGAYNDYVLWGKTFPVFFLLSWSEAFFTGLLTAVFISFAPHFIQTFSDEIYLSRRKSHF